MHLSLYITRTISVRNCDNGITIDAVENKSVIMAILANIALIVLPFARTMLLIKSYSVLLIYYETDRCVGQG
jgi:hypothetical protein